MIINIGQDIQHGARAHHPVAVVNAPNEQQLQLPLTTVSCWPCPCSSYYQPTAFMSDMQKVVVREHTPAELSTARVQPDRRASYVCSDDDHAGYETLELKADWEEHCSDEGSIITADDLIQQLVSTRISMCCHPRTTQEPSAAHVSCISS